ncbi:MAG: hypothetical protein HDR26_10060 [Lachnospiraceae bacterium]|nr:hypothetical protein [Lachnospiraceae bacterium]
MPVIRRYRIPYNLCGAQFCRGDLQDAAGAEAYDVTGGIAGDVTPSFYRAGIFAF